MSIRAVRSAHNPILHPGSDPSLLGNLNGPSLIRVPAWIENALGRYYLYFAHHQGTFIRMAYADDVLGPYHVYAPGVLDMSDTPFQKHVASPDVHVDEAARVIRMFYHGHGFRGEKPGYIRQNTCVAESPDGLAFASEKVCLGPAYMRVWRWEGAYYGFAGGSGSHLWRTSDAHQLFERGEVLEIESPSSRWWNRRRRRNGVTMRHPAVDLIGHELHVYYSNVGDRPERIKRTTIDLREDWRGWTGSAAREVLRTEADYEGLDQRIETSVRGSALEPVHQVRDPFLFNEGGRKYLVYSLAGEQGLGVAELIEESCP